MTKITKATFKSFVKNNFSKLYAKKNSSFDGMVDCVMPSNEEFNRIDKSEWAKNHSNNTLGIRQIWLVGRGQDWFSKYEDKNYTGIEYNNCCGNGVVAIKK